MSEQRLDQDEILKRAVDGAIEIARAVAENDFDRVLKLVDPVVIAMWGGEERMARAIRSELNQATDDELILTGIEVGEKPVIFRSGDELHTVVRYTLRFDYPGAAMMLNSYTIGISTDEGRNWRFIGGSDDVARQIRDYYPNLSPHLEFPPEEEPEITEVPQN